MPFPSLNLITHTNHIRKLQPTQKKSERKEKDLHLAVSPEKMTLHTERASVFISLPSSRKCVHVRKRKASGSISLQAAMALPLFFLAVLCLIYLLEIMAIQTSVRTGMQYAGKKLAEAMYPVPAMRPSAVESDMITAIGADRLNQSIVVDGSAGLHAESSRVSAITGIAEISVNYEVRLPFPVFAVPPVSYREEIRVKAWTGYVKTAFAGNSDKTVYISETGLVYHKDYHCTHLELSIRMVPAEQVGTLRNEGGGKYHQCERCGRQSTAGGVYITDTGDRYHNSLGCSGLKRSIYAVPLSEVIGKGACSRCGQ